jgi:YesN/AraC family two-component response regulator
MNEQVNEPAEEEEKILSEEPVSENPEENFKNDHVYREILERWMETEKPYRNADLRLDDLKARLPLNKTYLSQMINREFGCNFYHLITRYRIEEAKRMIRENPAMQLKEISDYCGFSSPTVFGRMFTRETGLTPRDWSLKNRLSFN